MDLSPAHCYEEICKVDVSALQAWLAGPGRSAPWIVQPHPENGNPERLHQYPTLVVPVVAAVLAHFPQGCRTEGMVLNRVRPGQCHAMHTDHPDPALFLTRVHVPLRTNPGCWHEFEFENHLLRFHMEPGTAYTFNTARRHAFGNDGNTERVHLLFDVLRR